MFKVLARSAKALINENGPAPSAQQAPAPAPEAPKKMSAKDLLEQTEQMYIKNTQALLNALNENSQKQTEQIVSAILAQRAPEAPAPEAPAPEAPAPEAPAPDASSAQFDLVELPEAPTKMSAQQMSVIADIVSNASSAILIGYYENMPVVESWHKRENGTGHFVRYITSAGKRHVVPLAEREKIRKIGPDNMGYVLQSVTEQTEQAPAPEAPNTANISTLQQAPEARAKQTERPAPSNGATLLQGVLPAPRKWHVKQSSARKRALALGQAYQIMLVDSVTEKIAPESNGASVESIVLEYLKTNLLPIYSGHVSFEVDRGMFWLYVGNTSERNSTWAYGSQQDRIVRSIAAHLNTISKLLPSA